MPTTQDVLNNPADLISALYLKYHDNLERYARRIGYTKEETEDLVQDTFAVVVQKQDKLLESKSRQAWACTSSLGKRLHKERFVKLPNLILSK